MTLHALGRGIALVLVFLAPLSLALASKAANPQRSRRPVRVMASLLRRILSLIPICARRVASPPLSGCSPRQTLYERGGEGTRRIVA